MKEIFRGLMEAMETNPKTVLELSKIIRSNWETTLKYLELIAWIQECPKVSRVQITAQIASWRREWGRIPS